MNTEMMTIIGSGPAGLTAAIYGARAGLSPVVYMGSMPGGQLTTTTDVENFPGFPKGIPGGELMENMIQQCEHLGVRFSHQDVTHVDLKKTSLKVKSHDKEWETKTLIIATGAKAKTLGLPGESQWMGRGLSTCATCDGFFYREKTVVVVGGGDAALEEALFLARICKEVLLVHRRESFRATHAMVERMKKQPKISLKVPYVVEKFLGEGETFKGVVLNSGGSLEEVLCDGLFYAIGHEPNTSLFASCLPVDAKGYLLTKDGVKTSIPGVFAAGDVADSVYRQAITSAGLGCQAAMEAARYLESQE